MKTWSQVERVAASKKVSFKQVGGAGAWVDGQRYYRAHEALNTLLNSPKFRCAECNMDAEADECWHGMDG